MPLMPGCALNSSIEPYGQYRIFWPFTFISMAMLPTEGRIETIVCVRASCSRTMSPPRCDEYGCASAAVATVRKRGASSGVIGRMLLEHHLCVLREEVTPEEP